MSKHDEFPLNASVLSVTTVGTIPEVAYLNVATAYRLFFFATLRFACDKSDPATTFSPAVDFLFLSSFPALDAAFFPVVIRSLPAKSSRVDQTEK